MPPKQESALSHLSHYGEKFLGELKNPAHTIWLGPVLLLADAVLSALIVKIISYTEIDWITYMQQIQKYVDGERDYAKITGDTGPIVYPAMHVYIYRILYALTNGGANILLAQVYFAFLYLFNLALVMMCYRLARAPPYIFPMLILSKRLHSIYMLRCFNDCFAVTALFLAIYLFQKQHWSYGAIVFSAGIGIKMSLLVALPAVVVLLYQANGPWKTLTQLMYMWQVQFISGYPFLSHNARNYVFRAFDFTRQFKYEWTVNWRFVPEDVFLSTRFSIGLLVAHVSLLLLFVFTRWLRPLGRSPRELARLAFGNPDPEVQKHIAQSLSADFVLTTILTSVAIGMLCARSLHYQFYAYLGWTVPFLLWRAKLNPVLQYILWFGQEMAWNVYPSVPITSKIIVGILAAVVIEVWLATDVETPKTAAEIRVESERNVQRYMQARYAKKTAKAEKSKAQ